MKIGLLSVLTLCWFCFSCCFGEELKKDGLNVCTKDVRVNVTRRATRIDEVEVTRYYCFLFIKVTKEAFESCPLGKNTEVVREEQEVIYTAYEIRDIEVTICCPGYEQIGSECPKPICEKGCNHGICLAPNTCICKDLYTGPTCDQDLCRLNGSDRKECGHPGISHDACKAKGCCWKPPEDESKDISCFFPNVTNLCTVDNGGCEQLCEYKNGDIKCHCFEGYARSSSESKRCIDIDECTVRVSPCYCDKNAPSCTATCVNLPGRFDCKCSQGYVIGSLEKTHCRDLDECSLNNGGCSHYCQNLVGSFKCLCPNGYELSTDGKTCLDINECNRNISKCEYQCNNLEGSFSCACQRGYILDGNGLTCSDHDECLNIDHGCQQKCENLKGHYRCGCYQGYKLNSDNKTCSDVDECIVKKEGTSQMLSGCAQKCTNKKGYFSCSCYDGFVLLGDGKTCTDFNECTNNKHDCQQICINTMGSFECKCAEGYDPDRNNPKQCKGKPCTKLEVIENGKASCLEGVTGDKCSFSCNHGYTLAGPKQRWCQANHTWNGTKAVCQRSKCAELMPPDNGAVSLPCDEEIGSSCEITCSEGYSLNSRNNRRKCLLEDNGDMRWDNELLLCREKDPCSPNPCLNGGQCSVDGNGNFQCKCPSNTSGSRCEFAVIRIPDIMAITKGRESNEFSIKASLVKITDLDITLRSNSENVTFIPSIIQIRGSLPTLKFKILGKTVGLFEVFLEISGSDSNMYMTLPKKSILSVNSASRMIVKYNESIVDGQGILRPGCNEHGEYPLRILSNTKFDGIETESGIVQVEAVDRTVLPISLSGLTKKKSGLTGHPLTNIFTQKSKNTQSIQKERPGKTCSSGGHHLTNFITVLENRAFTLSILEGFNKRFNYWIKISTQLHSEGSSFALSYSDFEGNVKKGEDLLMDRCFKGLTLRNDSWYYVYTTDQPLEINLPTGKVKLTKDVQKCFVKELSKGYVYFSIMFDQPLSIKKNMPSLFKILQQNAEVEQLTFKSEIIGQLNVLGFGESNLKKFQEDMDLKMRLKGIFEWTFLLLLPGKAYRPNFRALVGTSIDLNIKMKENESKSVTIKMKGKIHILDITDHIIRKNHCKSNTTMVNLAFLLEEANFQPNTHSISFGSSVRLNFLMEHKKRLPKVQLKFPSDDKSKILDNFHNFLNQTISDPWLLEFQQFLIKYFRFVFSRSRINISLKQYVDSLANLREMLAEGLRRVERLKRYVVESNTKEIVRVFQRYGTKLYKKLSSAFLRIPNSNETIDYIYIHGSGQFCLTERNCFSALNMILHGKKIQCYSNHTFNFWEPSHTTAALYSYPSNDAKITNIIKLYSRIPVKVVLTADPNMQETLKIESVIVDIYNEKHEGWLSIRGKHSIVGGIYDTSVHPLMTPSKLTFQVSEKNQSVDFYGQLTGRNTFFTHIDDEITTNLESLFNRLIIQREHIQGSRRVFTYRKRNINAAYQEKVLQHSLIKSQLARLDVDIDNYAEKVKNITDHDDIKTIKNEDVLIHFKRKCPQFLCEFDDMSLVDMKRCLHVEYEVDIKCTNEKTMDVIKMFLAKSKKKTVGVKEIKHCFTSFPQNFGLAGTVKNYRLKTGQWKKGNTHQRTCKATKVPYFDTVEGISIKREITQYQVEYEHCVNTLKKNKIISNFEVECVKRPKKYTFKNTCNNSEFSCDYINNIINDNIKDNIKLGDLYGALFNLQILVSRRKIIQTQLKNLQLSNNISKNTIDIATKNIETEKYFHPIFGTLGKRTINTVNRYWKEGNKVTIKRMDFMFKYHPGTYFSQKVRLNVTVKDNVINTRPDLILNATFDITNPKGSRDRVACTIVKNLIPNTKIRLGTPENSSIPKEIDLMDQLQCQNNCMHFERASIYLAQYLKALRNETENMINYTTQLMAVRSTAEKFIRSLHIRYSSFLNFSDNSLAMASTVKNIFKFEDELRKETYSVFWQNRFNSFLVHQEQLVQQRKPTVCFNVMDCISFYINVLGNLLKFEDITDEKINITEFKLNVIKLSLGSEIHTTLELKATVESAFTAFKEIIKYTYIFCSAAPGILQDLNDKHVLYLKEGEPLNLTIHINRQEGVRIEWIKDTKVIKSFTSFQNLVLPKLRSIDSGWYSCRLRNKHGITNCKIMKVVVLQELAIETQPQGFNTFVNDPQKHYLYCKVTGKPSTIRWYHQFVKDDNTATEVLSENEIITIPTKNTAESGYYWCVASNEEFSVQSEKALVNIIKISSSTPLSKITMTIYSSSTNKRNGRRKRRSSMSTDKVTVKEALASSMNIPTAQITDLEITYNGPTETKNIGKIAFVLHSNKEEYKVPSVDWDTLTKQAERQRQDLTKTTIKLYENIENGLNLNNGISISVDRDTINSAPEVVCLTPGSVLMENGFICALCEPGTRYSNQTCVKCSEGYYQPDPGQNNCLICPVRKTTSERGAVTEDECHLDTTKTITITTSTTTEVTLSPLKTKATTTITERKTSIFTATTIVKTNKPIQTTTVTNTTRDPSKSKNSNNNPGKSTITITAVVIAIVLLGAIIILIACRRRRRSIEITKKSSAVTGRNNPMFDEINKPDDQGKANVETCFDDGIEDTGKRDQSMAFTNYIYEDSGDLKLTDATFDYKTLEEKEK